MAVFLHTSNSAAALADGLRAYLDRRLAASPDPLIAPLVMVPNTFADRWLRQAWALKAGIVMHLDLPYLERGIRESFSSAWRPVSKDLIALMTLIELLEAARSEPEWAREALDYARGTRSDRLNQSRLWDYAASLAEYFDNYDLHRLDDPEMAEILAKNSLQSTLIKLIAQRIKGLEGQEQRPYLFLRDLARGWGEVSSARRAQIESWGLHLFAFDAISPLHLKILLRLARDSGGELHFWQLAPVVKTANQTLKRWTRTAESFKRLLEKEAGEEIQLEHLEQDGVFCRILSGEAQALADPDQAAAELDALRLVGAPTILREVEMVYNSILYHLANDPELEQDQIAVFVPDLDRYRATIKAVFSDGIKDGELALGFSFATGQTGERSEWLKGFELILDFSSTERASLYRLLTNPAVLARLELGRGEIEDWFKLVERLGIFGGRIGPGSEPVAGFSWARGLARLRLGRVFRAGVWQGLVPLESEDNELGERLMPYLERLEAARVKLGELNQSGAEWGKTLLAYADSFLALPAEDSLGERLARSGLARLLGQLEPLPEVGFELVRAWLASGLDGLGRRDYRRGGVVVAGMRDLRPVPFKLIFLLGFGEGIYPSPKKSRSSLDLLERDQARWPGDLEDSDRQRMLFVETLLATQSRLVISYQNRDQLKDSPLYPSSLVNDLLLLIGRKPPIHRLPLLPWELELEGAEAWPEIFAEYRQLEREIAFLSPRKPEPVREGQALEPPTGLNLSLLVKIFKNPAQALLERDFGRTDLSGEIPNLEPDEPFFATQEAGLVKSWDLEQPLVIEWLTSSSEEELESYFLRRGAAEYRQAYRLADRVPQGFFGDLFWEVLVQRFRKKSYSLAGVKPRVRAALEAQAVYAPLVFGRPPRAKEARVLGPLLPAIPLGAGLSLSGQVELAWLEDRTRLCLFTDLAYPKPKEVGIESLSSLLKYLLLALPSVRAGLGFDQLGPVSLIYQGGQELRIEPGAEQEESLRRVLELYRDSREPELLPIKCLLDTKNKLQSQAQLLEKLLEAQDNQYEKSWRATPVETLARLSVPQDQIIQAWHEEILAPWLKLIKPETPAGEGQVDDK